MDSNHIPLAPSLLIWCWGNTSFLPRYLAQLTKQRWVTQDMLTNLFRVVGIAAGGVDLARVDGGSSSRAGDRRHGCPLLLDSASQGQDIILRHIVGLQSRFRVVELLVVVEDKLLLGWDIALYVRACNEMRGCQESKSLFSCMARG